MAGIVLSIEVDDKGTVKIRQFSDETKKAFAEMKKAPQEARGSLDSLRDSWVGVTAKVGIATAAFYAAKRLIYDTAKEIASAGNDIQRMSRTFNMSTDDFQRWSYVAKMADVNIQEFGMGFKLLTQAIANAIQEEGDAAKAFSILGINLKDTTGKTKDQQVVLMETIGALEKFEDGANRDALMIALFGRSFIAIKPLVNQGTKAIQENREQAERLSLILGKDVIKSLSESEDSFKKWSMTLNVAKMETFEPLVNILGSMLERIMALKKAWAEGGIKGVYQDILAAQEQAGIEALAPAAWTKEWVAGWTPPTAKKKPEAPGLAKTGDILTEIEQRDLLVKRLTEEYVAVEQLNEEYVKEADAVGMTVYEYEKVKNIVGEMQGSLERLKRETNEWGEITVVQQELIEVGWKKTISFGETLAQNFANSWDFNVKRIISESENMGDALKNIFDGMADAFSSAISKMISNWVLFGNATGEYKSGSGVVGWLGTALTNIVGMQHGGWINEPIYGIGKSGQRYTFGESESEMVVPKSQIGGGGGNTYYIDARGAQRGVSAEIRRAIRESENRAVKRSVNEVVDNKMRGGRFAKIFES